jgi:hypothetical protein
MDHVRALLSCYPAHKRRADKRFRVSATFTDTRKARPAFVSKQSLFVARRGIRRLDSVFLPRSGNRFHTGGRDLWIPDMGRLSREFFVSLPLRTRVICLAMLWATAAIFPRLGRIVHGRHGASTAWFLPSYRGVAMRREPRVADGGFRV